MKVSDSYEQKVLFQIWLPLEVALWLDHQVKDGAVKSRAAAVSKLVFDAKKTTELK